MHSHLLPGLDDGVKTFEESAAVISAFQQMGYKKLITTPHVMRDIYRNTTPVITAKLEALREHLKNAGIDINVDAAAEYYLDEGVLHDVETNVPLLTFGAKHLLFETNFINEPFILKQFIFMAISHGYRPVLAHPERYMYLQENYDKAEDLLHRGVLFQVNLASLTGVYSRSAQRLAAHLIEKGFVHYLGSDCHHMDHALMIRDIWRNKYFEKALNLPLLNNSLE